MDFSSRTNVPTGSKNFVRPPPLINSPDHVYVNMTLYNNSFENPSSPNQYIPATISQTRDSSIIDNPEEYNLTITRFSIPSENIARAYQAVTSNTGPTGTRYWVGLEYNGAFFDEPIVFPTITDANLKLAKLEYNIFAIMGLINAGFAAAQAAVITAGGPTGPGQVIMTYDPATQLYDLNIPSWYGTGTTGGTGQGIAVHMSYFLNQRFNSFNSLQNAPLLYNNHDVTFVRSWLGDNLVSNIYTNVGTGGTGITGNYMVLRQDAAWPSALMDTCRLLLTTASIPIVQEYKAVTDYLNLPSGNKIQPIITDFFIGRDSELQSRAEALIYLPDFYRLTALKGNTPITQLDITAYVQDCTGFYYPLLIPPGGSMDLKLLFIRKGLVN